MARRISPYVATRGRASLVDRLLASKARDTSKVETTKQKKKLSDEYREEVRGLYQKAMSKGKNKWSDVLKAGGLAATIFGGPLAAGLTNALINYYQGEQQRKASKTLLGLDEKRWGKTFLGEEASKYMDEAEKQQISAGKVLTDALVAGGMAAATSGSIGGDKGLGARITDARKLAQVGGDASTLIKGAIPKGTPITKGPAAKPGATTSKAYKIKDPSFLTKTPAKLATTTTTIGPKGGTTTIQSPAAPGTARYATDIAPSKAGFQAMKGSFADMFTGAGSKDIMKKLTPLMMLPMLLKQYSK